MQTVWEYTRLVGDEHMTGILTDEQLVKLRNNIKEALSFISFASDEIIAIGKTKRISDEVDDLVSKAMIDIEHIIDCLRRIRVLVNEKP
jgi:Xaa-Pro aminopeptidase